MADPLGANPLRCTVYATADLTTADAIRPLWRHLRAPVFEAASFGTSEQPTEPVTDDDADAPRKLFEREQALSVASARGDSLFMAGPLVEGWARWDVWVARERFEAGLEDWCTWLGGFFGAAKMLFGFACAESEFDAKHETRQKLPGGGVATGGVGASRQEFRRYLPGVYWLTAFGKTLTRELRPCERLQEDGVRLQRLSGGEAVMILNEPLVPSDLDGRLQREQAVADALEARHFFNREKDAGAFEQHPALVSELDRLAGR